MFNLPFNFIDLFPIFVLGECNKLDKYKVLASDVYVKLLYMKQLFSIIEYYTLSR